MRKNSFVICWLTSCLLSAVPGNQGVTLLESLSCVQSYPEGKLTCTWSENRALGNLVNVTLMTTTERSPSKNACLKRSLTRGSQQNIWTCSIVLNATSETDHFSLSFLPERSLETRLNSEEEKDEAKPQNLHCDDNDGNITCSWQVREEIAESFDFGLFYGNDTNECEPDCQHKIPKYLFCQCNIRTDSHLNTSALMKTISVKPSNKASPQTYVLCLIYQLSPINLTINETRKGEIFIATWTHNEVPTSKYLYELCYWDERDLEIKGPSVCPGKSEQISNSHELKKIFWLGEQLKPSSNYSLMGRVRLVARTNQCYQGPWSEWSRVQTMTTKAVPNLFLLYILIPVCVIVAVMFVFYGYRALIKYTKQWNEKIPNPNKSSIFKSLQKTKKGSCLPFKEHLYVEPCNNIIMCTPSVTEEKINSLKSEHVPGEDAKSCVLSDPIKKDYPTASIADDYKPFSDLTSEQESEDTFECEFKAKKDSEFAFSAFDGPYLFSECN
ncbi:uncharacterized protein [Pyxicephalus adspersus]